jgi:hypothetical protein
MSSQPSDLQGQKTLFLDEAEEERAREKILCGLLAV